MSEWLLTVKWLGSPGNNDYDYARRVSTTTNFLFAAANASRARFVCSGSTPKGRTCFVQFGFSANRKAKAAANQVLALASAANIIGLKCKIDKELS